MPFVAGLLGEAFTFEGEFSIFLARFHDQTIAARVAAFLKELCHASGTEFRLATCSGRSDQNQVISDTSHGATARLKMSNRRHLGRASHRLLPAHASLYEAVQTIIGHELRTRYAPPDDTPPEIGRLLAVLGEADAEADTDGASSRAANTAPARAPHQLTKSQ